MKRRIIFDLLIIFILGLIPLLWFKDGTIVLGHDAGLTLDPVSNFLDRLYVWTQRFGIGSDQSFALLGAFLIHGIEAFLAWVGFSLPLQQKIQFVFWFVLPGLTMYFLAFKLWPEKRYLPLIASVIYMINYYLIQAWFIAERTKFSIYAGLPLFVYFLLSYFLGKTSFLPSVIFAGLMLSIFNGGGSIPLYGGLLLVVLTTYIYFALLKFEKRTFIKILYFSGGVSLVYLLLNAYWLVPYLFYILGFYGRDLALAGGPSGALGWAEYLSQGATFFNLLRGQGIPDWYLNPYHAFSRNFFTNPNLIILSFVFPILAYVSLFFVSGRKSKLFIYLLIILSLVALVFTAGPRSQVGIIYRALALYLPGFAIFRSVYYKFGYAFWFAYAILIAFSLDYIFLRIQAKIPKNLAVYFQGAAIAVVIIFILFYHYPILNGSFLDYSHEPKKERTTRIKVPEYVFEFSKWMKKQNLDTRYLIAPELSETGYVAYNWKYWSISPLNSLFSRHSFVQNTLLLPESERLIMLKMYLDLQRKDFKSFFDFAEVFAINGIVLQKDADWKNSLWGSTNPKIYEQIIESNPNFNLVETFREWKVYDIVGRSRPPRVVASSRLSFLEGELKNVMSFPQFDARVPIFMGSRDKKNSPYFVREASEVFLVPECFNCSLEEGGKGVTFYDPKILPGSIIYPVVTAQENIIKSRSYDFKSRLNYYITISDRRIIEAKSMIERELFLHKLEETLDRYRRTLSELQKIVRQKDWKMSGKEESTVADEASKHLLAQATWVEGLFENKHVSEESRKILSEAYEILLNIESKVRERIWITKNTEDKRYIFELPKVDEYEVYVKKSTLSDEADFEGSVLTLAERPNLRLAPVSEVDGWLYYGSLRFESDRLKLGLVDSTVKNLLDNVSPSLPSNQKGIEVGNGTLSFTTDSIDKCAQYKVLGLETIDAKYRLTFEYRNFTDKRDLSFYLTFPQETTRKLDILSTFLSNSRGFRMEERFITTKDGRINIFFCNGFASLEEKIKGEEVRASLVPGQTMVDIKNIRLIKVSLPAIILYKKQRDINHQDFVSSFEKTSPVSYEVDIKESKGPLSLTIRESYGKYWQVCGESGKCYPFDAKVHFASADYGNAWYFPDGLSGKIKVYYLPQLMFTIGSYISIISLVIIVLAICYGILKKK